MRLQFSPHVAFPVKNQPEAAAFYRDLMGWEVVTETPGETAFKCGPIYFYVEASDRITTYFEFVTDNLAEARDKFAAAGCRIIPEKTPEGNDSCYVIDPYGFAFHLYEEK